MPKQKIDTVTAKWAAKHGIKVWQSTDGRFAASFGNDPDTVQIADTAREAFSRVMKTQNPDDDLPPPPPEKKQVEREATTTTLSEQPIRVGIPGIAEVRSITFPPVPPPPFPTNGSAEPKPHRTRVPKGDLSGVNSEIKRVCYEYPNASPDRILEILQERGFASTRGSVLSIGAGFRSSMAVLRQLGWGPKEETTE